MKIILFLTCLAALLTTSGCLVEDQGGYRHGGYERHSEVVVPIVPVVVVHPAAEVIVR